MESDFSKKLDKFSNKINGYLNNLNYKSNTPMKLQSDTHANFAPAVWILGVLYTPSHHLSDGINDFMDHNGTNLMSDISSRFWFTYRQNFPGIQVARKSQENIKTADTGWGCCIRVTQMFVAQMLVLKLMGRSWRKESGEIDVKKLRCRVKDCRWIYQSILEMFLDLPGQAFSIHTISELISRELNSENWQPGDWIGPATAANIIKHGIYLANSSCTLGLQLDDIRVYIARDALIDPSEVYPESRLDQQDDDFVVVLIPLRLGANEFNMEYKNCVLKLFCFDNFLGIIGGKPKKSFYFIGAQGDDLIYLDPHFTQKAFNSTDEVDFDTYHCNKPKTVNISKMDPTCTIGFVFRAKKEFEDFQRLCEDSKLFHREVEKAGSCKFSCPMVAFGKRQDSSRTRLYTENDMCVIEDDFEVDENTPTEDVGYVLL